MTQALREALTTLLDYHTRTTGDADSGPVTAAKAVLAKLPVYSKVQLADLPPKTLIGLARYAYPDCAIVETLIAAIDNLERDVRQLETDIRTRTYDA
jgi:hypothetical protein